MVKDSNPQHPLPSTNQLALGGALDVATAQEIQNPTVQSKKAAEILLVSKKVFAEFGYRNTDVQVIADQVGVGKGTIYRAFGSKEGLFYATVDECMHRLNDAMIDEPYGPITTENLTIRLEEKFLAFFRFFDANPEVVELLIQERSEFRQRDSNSYTRNWLSNSPRWRERIQKCIDADNYRKLPVDDFIDVANDLLYGAIFTHYFAKRTMTLESGAKSVADIFLNGVLSQSARLKESSEFISEQESGISEK